MNGSHTTPRQRNEVSQKPRCADPDPLAVIEEEHALHLELCDVLECLADCLPHNADRALAGVAKSILCEGFLVHLQTEEQVLFRLLERHAAVGFLGPVIEHLKAEHAWDECAALEIAEELAVLAEHGSVANPDMLGHMLRGFIDSQRHHIEWENRVLLPLIRQTFMPEDLSELRAWITSIPRPRCIKDSLAALKRVSNGLASCRRCASRARLIN